MRDDSTCGGGAVRAPLATVGCVPFVNAKPLIEGLAEEGIEVVFAMPSKLPAMLDSGEIAAALVSSFDALTKPNRCLAWGVCIGSFGPAESVRLFSKVPFDQVKSLALDQSSLTSNSLAQILLARRYGARPFAEPQPPDLTTMLTTNDAALLIGDQGMLADGTGLFELDLGECWTQTTGLPFVWAMWVGASRKTLDAELAGRLNQSFERWLERRRDRIPEVAREAGWDEITTARYLEHTMMYRLGDREWAGLMAYRQALIEFGWASADLMPEVIMPATAGPARCAAGPPTKGGGPRIGLPSGESG